MKVLINEKDVAFDVNENNNFGEFLASVQDYVREDDSSKLVVDIKVDGEQIFKNEHDPSELSLKDINKVEVTTDNVKDVSIRALQEIKSELPLLAELMSNISTSFQEGKREHALNLFSDLCNEWRQIIQFFDDLSRVLFIDYSQIDLGDKSIDQANGELLSRLVETKTAIEKDDLVTLSDLVEYELIPKIDEEIDIVDKIISYLENLEN